MANFNTDVSIIPDRGISTDQTARIFRATYGDGYEQRVAAGINTLPEEWSLSWNNRTANDANKVIKFLEDQKGATAFDWYPPDSEISSSTTSSFDFKLIDTAQSFTNRLLGSTIATSGGTATISAIDSGTALSLSSNLIPSSTSAGLDYSIYPTKKYRCEKWNTSIPFLGYRTVTATFIRVFEP